MAPGHGIGEDLAGEFCQCSWQRKPMIGEAWNSKDSRRPIRLSWPRERWSLRRWLFFATAFFQEIRRGIDQINCPLANGSRVPSTFSRLSCFPSVERCDSFPLHHRDRWMESGVALQILEPSITGIAGPSTGKVSCERWCYLTSTRHSGLKSRFFSNGYPAGLQRIRVFPSR